LFLAAPWLSRFAVTDSEPRELTSGHADERDHSSGAIVIAAPGKKLRGVAKSTASNQVDPIRPESRGD